ncbi:hypothetical protein LG298_07455 [Cytobacillus firmus]|uniref:hypothetical protein n=1 Tax=Cytobacillus firmus TaxID=1399 RepID=UPI0038512D94
MRIYAEIGDQNELDKVLQRRDKDANDKAMHFHGLMQSRNIPMTIEEINFTEVTFSAWNYESQMTVPMAVVAPCGFGKSSMLQTWVVHNAKNKEDLWGAIVAFPKRSQVIEFCNEIKEQTSKLTAFPFLGKTADMSETVYKEQFKIQEKAPALVMTHKMLELLSSQGKLQEFTKWYDSEGQARRRTQLFIDERPNFVEVQSLSATQIEKVADLVRAVSMTAHGYEKPYCKLIRDKAEELKQELQKPIEEGSEAMFPTKPIDLFFKIPTELFYDWLKHSEQLGNDYSLLGVFQEAIQRGGTVSVSGFGKGTGTSFFVGAQVWNEISFMNTFVLDGTAIGDKLYELRPFNKISPVIPEDAYQQLTVKVSNKHNLGRDFFDRNKEAVPKTVKLVKELMSKHEKLAVVVYKDLFEEYEKALQIPILQGKVAMKYFDNERATNSFKDCDAIIFLGMNRKHLTHYIETSKAVTGNEVEYGGSTSGGFRFNSETVNEFYFSDMFVDRKQGMERIRSYKSKTPKTVYMFSTYEELPEKLLEASEGARVVDWELSFKLTDGEDKKDSKQRFKEWLQEFAQEPNGTKVKGKEVYENELEIASAQWTRLKKDSEVLALMDSLGVSFKGQSILKD